MTLSSFNFIIKKVFLTSMEGESCDLRLTCTGETLCQQNRAEGGAAHTNMDVQRGLCALWWKLSHLLHKIIITGCLSTCMEHVVTTDFT